ncbi:hypothetical protein [Streptomyces sp. NBC_01306]|uniref:oxidoreductase n=1 Tax=Streptomyces sp. NBC_01306 TaxID=2903819 RepID=UPI002B1E2CDA|nr:hypothetical protein [Streptomyces sp. NBC_01306]
MSYRPRRVPVRPGNGPRDSAGEGAGYMNSPGLHTPAQIAAWRTVADAVHQNGGRIVAQIMHAGRISHPDNKHHAETVAPRACLQRVISTSGLTRW